MYKISNKIFLGTWNISSSGFKKNEIEKKLFFNLLDNSLKYGIRKIDTSSKYGNIEKKIAEYKKKNFFFISSKIPAKNKPKLNTDDYYFNYYDNDYIKKYVYQILKNFRKNNLDLILLHNWSYFWNKNSLNILKTLINLKKIGLIKNIGISLPDNFNHDINFLLDKEYIDYIMLPLNPLNEWSINKIILPIEKKNINIKIIVRSFFCSGLLYLKDFFSNINDPRWLRYKKDLLINKIREITKNKTNNIKDIRNLLLLRYKKILLFKNVYICLGIRSLKQLKENILFFNKIYEND